MKTLSVMRSRADNSLKASLKSYVMRRSLRLVRTRKISLSLANKLRSLGVLVIVEGTNN